MMIASSGHGCFWAESSAQLSLNKICYQDQVALTVNRVYQQPLFGTQLAHYNLAMS
jgi:hypothetical protein